MLRRGDLNILSFKGWRTFQIESPSFCEGLFRFSDTTCLTCPFHVECELVTVTEFGFAGRPNSILKEYFYALPFFHKVVLPDKVAELFPYVVPRTLPVKMRRVVRTQLRAVYKMYLLPDIFKFWEIVPLREGTFLNYYSKLQVPSSYFEWFSQEQLARISLTVRSLISRSSVEAPFVVITIESSGWFCECIKQVISFPYAEDSFFWMSARFPETPEIREAIEDVVGKSFCERQLPLVTLTTPAILVWLVNEPSFIQYVSWLKNNLNFVKYVVALFDDLKYFKLLQCFLFPLMVDVVSFPGAHFPYVCLFKVVQRGKSLSLRLEHPNEVFAEHVQ